MAGITPELAKVSPDVAQAWLKALEAEGAIVGNTPYQVRRGELKEGVNPDKKAALEGVLKATKSVLKLDDSVVKQHALYLFGCRTVEAAHGVSDAANHAEWVSRLTSAMKGELNEGVGAQAQSMMTNLGTAVVGAAYSQLSEEQDQIRMNELESKGTLTRDEAKELERIKGSDFTRLEKIEKDGWRSLTEDEAAKLSEYRTRDQAARQAEQQAAMRDMHDLTQKKVRNDGLSTEEQQRYNEYLKDNQMREHRQQMEVDLRKADAQHVASTAIANEQAAEHARRHRDPEPGSLPAVASGRAPVGVDSLAAVDKILQKERVKEELAGMLSSQQMKEVVDDANEKKTPAYQVKQEISRLKARTLEMQGLPKEQKNPQR